MPPGIGGLNLLKKAQVKATFKLYLMYKSPLIGSQVVSTYISNRSVNSTAARSSESSSWIVTGAQPPIPSTYVRHYDHPIYTINVNP